jgi:hypothetical protein
MKLDRNFGRIGAGRNYDGIPTADDRRRQIIGLLATEMQVNDRDVKSRGRRKDPRIGKRFRHACDNASFFLDDLTEAEGQHGLVFNDNNAKSSQRVCIGFT